MARDTASVILTSVLLSAWSLGACTAANGQAGTATTSTQSTESAATVRAPQPRNFAEWKAGFRARALESGIVPVVFDKAFSGIELNERVISLDSRQPEFTRPIWEYLDSAVSNSRVSTGRAQAEAKRAVLNQIEKRYGADYEAVLAIWGLESGFGSNFGSIPVIESMATLAYEGRRKKFAEEQLIAALRILQAGDIEPAQMVGSWAGAMGHTQFIPTSFLSYAVDFTGDGRRDLWAADAQDALASTANYLGRFGWTRGSPAVVEVVLPKGFDYALADDATRMTAAEWRALGARAMEGRLAMGDEMISILLPAGARGPAFAAYPNFRVIKRYNNSTSYALAVAKLADRIKGGPGIKAAWPRGDRPLSRTEKKDLQQRLTALGYDTQGVDGIIGPNSRKAVRGFQQANGLLPDGYVSASLLEAVHRAGG